MKTNMSKYTDFQETMARQYEESTKMTQMHSSKLRVDRNANEPTDPHLQFSTLILKYR